MLDPGVTPTSGQPNRSSALFAYGFRPFFLGAGLYACLAMAAWLTWMGLDFAHVGVEAGTLSFSVFVWHAHEMVFGFVPAVIAGFMLTAVPSWTGAPPLSGRPLAALAGLWVAGRIAVWVSAYLPSLAVALIDLAFLPALMLAVAMPLFRARAWRNILFLVILGLMAAANLMVHLEFLDLAADGAAFGHLLGVDMIALLIAIVGGRVTPAFTANWLQREGIDASVVRRRIFDVVALAAIALVAVADAADAPSWVTGALAAAAAAGLLGRMAGWRGERVMGEPIVWILHVGHAWLVIAFAVRAFALLFGGMAETAALHAFTVGAVGSITLGVMSRAALGHTGRALKVAPSITGAYVAVSLAALIRVGGPELLPDLLGPLMLVSGSLWVLAFGLFSAVYWPILTRPRPDGNPG